MIDLSVLSKPDVLKTLNYEDILKENINNFKQIVPDWEPLEGDQYLMLIEAFSYREVMLRATLNEYAKAFFLATAKANDLDNLAITYNIQRLKGSFPYAKYQFSLSEVLTQDIVIPVNLTLTDENSNYTAKLIEPLTIKAGNKTIEGTVELQHEVSTLATKTENITTTLPYLVTAKALESFKNGADVENDTNLLNRILLSMADKSTAGSEETYKSYTFKADKRIEDVVAINGGAGVVEIYYYSKEADDIMKTRIETVLNAKETRPLTDKVIVKKAIEKHFNITANLKILPNQEASSVYLNAITNLQKGLSELKKIGVSITLSEINDFLRVAGVKEVVINSPITNVTVEPNQIGVCDEQNITFTII